jgi:hypothetical protein
MKRRGISLVEVITLMSGVTLILTMTGTLLHRAMQTQLQTRHFFDGERNALRLSNQFRAEVHQARSASINESASADGELLRLELEGNETVAYQRQQESVWRVLSRDDQPVSREEYRLGAAGEISVRREESPSRLVLTVEAEKDAPPPGPNDPPARVRDAPLSFQAEAVLSRDRRYAEPAAGQGGAP